MPTFRDHFSSSAAQYASFRPVYPAAFVEELVALAPTRALAWDCATGNGQAARLLAPHFRRVIATDASAEQIANAAPQANIEFRVGQEDESGAANGSVDLVTVATALHWLDLDRFYGEVRRVATPGAVIAAWGYGWPAVDAAVDAVMRWFAFDRVGRYWPPERAHLESGYRQLPFPFEEEPAREREMHAALDADQFIGYLGTWSSVAGAKVAEAIDPLPELRERLQAVWPLHERRLVTWPLYARIGRVHTAG